MCWSSGEKPAEMKTLGQSTAVDRWTRVYSQPNLQVVESGCWTGMAAGFLELLPITSGVVFAGSSMVSDTSFRQVAQMLALHLGTGRSLNC